MKGDQAFFYHSNCKKPGIVGIMEIVREHSIDGEHLLSYDSHSLLRYFDILTFTMVRKRF